MRAFNKREQDFIKKLITIDISNNVTFDFFLEKNYFTEENKRALFIFKSLKKAVLYLEHDLFETNRIKESNEMMELLSLLLYLKEKRYITLFQNQENYQADTFIIIIGNYFNFINKNEKGVISIENEEGWTFNSKDFVIYDAKGNSMYKGFDLDFNVYEHILENFTGIIHVTEELAQLVERDFKSEEHIRFKKQQVATWVSIALAIVLGLLSIYIQICTKI